MLNTVIVGEKKNISITAGVIDASLRLGEAQHDVVHVSPLRVWPHC